MWGVPMKEGDSLRQHMEPLTHLAACRRGALERKTLLRMDERISKGLCRSRLRVSGGGRA